MARNIMLRLLDLEYAGAEQTIRRKAAEVGQREELSHGRARPHRAVEDLEVLQDFKALSIAWDSVMLAHTAIGSALASADQCRVSRRDRAGIRVWRQQNRELASAKRTCSERCTRSICKVRATLRLP